MTIEEQSLFSDYGAPNAGTQTKSKSYDEFVQKFEHKRTTDDCYTPPAVYDAVLSWVRENCDIEGCNIIRPFYPGGDYVNHPYGESDVVVDNPPFSIITQIVKHYMSRGIRFFLFAPYLTLLRPAKCCTGIVVDYTMTYENGAKVNTSFVSNMFGDCVLMTAPELRRRIIVANSSDDRRLPKYVYPANVLTATMLGYLCKYNVNFSVDRASCHFIYRLRSQGSKAIFGGGYLLSDRKADEKRALEEMVAERRAPIAWELSDEERRIIEQLK